MRKIIISLIYLYKLIISPLLAHRCRFYPTCSSYAILAIEKHGIINGGYRALKRIMKCHPFNPGGYDPI